MTARADPTEQDFDVVELAPYAPPPDAAPLREVAFRSNAWLPAEVDRLRAMFADDLPLDEICAALGRPAAGVATKLRELGLRRRTARPWSELEDAELARRYGDEPAARIAQDLGRAVASVYVRAQLLGLAQEAAPPYDPWEDAQIRAGYAAGVPLPRIAALIGRPIAGMVTHACRLGLRHPAKPDDWSDEEAGRALELAVGGMRYRAICEQLAAEGFPPRTKAGLQPQLWKMGYRRGWGRPWTPEEDELLRAAYRDGASLTPLRERLGRDRSGIACRAKILGLQGTHAIKAGWRTEPPWTEAEDEILRREYASTPPAEIARRLGRTKAGVYTRAWNLNLETGRYRAMTADEDRAVRIAAGRGWPIGVVARALGRDVNVIKKRAAFLGVMFVTNPQNPHIARRAARALGPMTLADILAHEGDAAQTLDQPTLGVLISGMSDASAATLLERPVAWVAEQRTRLHLRDAA